MQKFIRLTHTLHTDSALSVLAKARLWRVFSFFRSVRLYRPGLEKVVSYRNVSLETEQTI